MCGICGICFIDERLPDSEGLRLMNNTLRHRGPDDEGYYISKGIGLGMRRLKIIDLEYGNQPIFNENKGICVVYNGEIYNFIEWRDWLKERGHRFVTKTDTEVIVHLYEEFGIDFVSKLNGMFAFALWDNTIRTLYLVRDQFGIKPLYYSFLNSGIIFGSEIKAILKYPGIKKEIDLDSLCRYLIAEYVPSPHSIYRGIYKLPPGSFLKFNSGSYEIQKYWSLKLKRNERTVSLQEAEDELRQLLNDSVRTRLISDVPLGAFLSGGIDSATVVYFMKKFHDRRVKTFSVSFDDPSFDESRYSRMVSGFLGTQHYERRMTEKDLLEAIPEIFNFVDEPVGDASIVPTYLLSKFTREYVTVALSGDGGDELFAGYPTYVAHKIADVYSRIIPSVIHRRLFLKIADALPVSFNDFSIDFKIKRFMHYAKHQPFQRGIFWMGSFDEDELKKLISFPLQRTDFYEEQKEIYELYNKEAIPTEIAQILDFTFYLQEDVLVKVDRASMACSLEVRIPFLDPRIVEYVWSLPPGLKLKNFTTKYLLKKTMEGLLPARVLKRKKKGFGIPVAKWFAGVMKEVVLDTFSESRLRKDGFFNPEYVMKLLDEHFKKKVDHRKKLWTLFAFQQWLEKQFYL